MSTLGKSEYGLFALVNSIIAYIVLLDLGFGSAVIRFNAKYISENDSAGQRNINGMFLLLFSAIGLLSLLASVILVFNFDVIFSSLDEAELGILKTIFIIAAINVAVSFPLNIFSSIITAYERFVYLKNHQSDPRGPLSRHDGTGPAVRFQIDRNGHRCACAEPDDRRD
ncbi:lipopolysaccharide biosynthesis protein [Paenibacillus rhizoplanae]